MRLFIKGVSASLVVLLIAAALASCGGAPAASPAPGATSPATPASPAPAAPTPAPAAPATPATPAAAKDIVIGVLSPTSGSEAYYGTDMLQSYQLAVAEINAAGGILGRQVSLYAADDG